MTHLEEVKTWLAALELWRMARAPTMPPVPPSVQTWLMDQAMELDAPRVPRVPRVQETTDPPDPEPLF